MIKKSGDFKWKLSRENRKKENGDIWRPVKFICRIFVKGCQGNCLKYHVVSLLPCIDTTEIEKAAEANIDALTDRRRELYKIRRAGHGGDAITDEITGLTARVRELRRELKLCVRIERDIPTVKEAVQADTSETRSVTHEKTDKSRPQRHFETGRGVSGGGGPGR